MNFLQQIISTYNKGLAYDSLQDSLTSSEESYKELQLAFDELLRSKNLADQQLEEIKLMNEKLLSRGKINILDLKDYYEGLFSGPAFTYAYLGDGVKKDTKMVLVDNPAQKDTLKDLSVSIIDKYNPQSPQEGVGKVMKYFSYKKEWSYKTDLVEYGKLEYWQKAGESAITRRGDCISGEEEIITISGIKKVKDLKEGDLVLSYDFNKKEQVYKPIISFVNKGVQPVKVIEFRNRNKIVVTDGHPMFMRTNQKGPSHYEKTYVKDIDITRWWKRKTPLAKGLTINTKDNDLHEDIMFIIGHFLAEGWCEGSHVKTSGYDIPYNIQPLLDKHNIPYSIGKNNSGVPVVNFLESSFKKLFSSLKTNSFDIHIPKEWLYLPENKIQRLLDGYFLGDGHYHNKSSLCKVYSTSSEQWASDIVFLSARLGENIYAYKQLKHGGSGNKPIWRLEYNKNSKFNNYFGNSQLSEVSIKHIEDFGTCNVYDFEVADTHCYFHKNGLLLHNCDDLAILMHNTIYYLFEQKGWLDHYWRLSVAFVELVSGEGWHLVNLWVGDDGETYVVESTYDLRESLAKTWLNAPVRYMNLYKRFTGRFRKDKSWQHQDSDFVLKGE